MRRLAETVFDARGVFAPGVLARDRGDGSWEGWLEFTPVGTDVADGVITPIETASTIAWRWSAGHPG